MISLKKIDTNQNEYLAAVWTTQDWGLLRLGKIISNKSFITQNTLGKFTHNLTQTPLET
jgi:hypothetical protein